MPVIHDPNLPPVVQRAPLATPEPRRPPPSVERAILINRVMQVVSYLFGILYALIGFQFMLELFAARDRNGVKQFLDAVTAPFLGPFRTLLPSMEIGGSELIFSYIVALLVYASIHLAINRLAKIMATPSSELVP